MLEVQFSYVEDEKKKKKEWAFRILQVPKAPLRRTRHQAPAALPTLKQWLLRAYLAASVQIDCAECARRQAAGEAANSKKATAPAVAVQRVQVEM